MGLIDRLAQSMSLRLRIFLFFLLALVTCLAMVGFAGWLFLGGIDAESMALVSRAGVFSAFAIAAIIIAVWFQFDTHVARPIERMGRYAHSAAHAGGLSEAAMPSAQYLGYLAPAVADLSQALDAARNRREEAVRDATALAERQKARLESVLHDLRDGILICNREHQVLLYNPRAAHILDDIGAIGLRRSVFDVLSPGPVRHSVDRLVKRFREGRHLSHEDGLSLPFAALCADGRTTIEATMTLTLVQGSDQPEGYILSFSDETETLAASAEAERQLIAVSEKIREEAASMHLIGEMLNRADGLPPPAREMTEALMKEVRTLAQSASRLDALAQDQLARTWPMAPVLANTLFDLVGERARLENPITHHAEPGVAILCDSAAIAALLARLAEWIAGRGGAEIAITAEPGPVLGFVDLAWTGEMPMIRDVNAWLATALDHDLGPVTALDVLARHASDVWPEDLGDGRVRLRMPLAMRDASRMLVLPERFELSTSPLPRECSTPELRQPAGALLAIRYRGAQGVWRRCATRRPTCLPAGIKPAAYTAGRMACYRSPLRVCSPKL
jgi:DNA polymerase-3 subunit epsilon